MTREYVVGPGERHLLESTLHITNVNLGWLLVTGGVREYDPASPEQEIWMVGRHNGNPTGVPWRSYVTISEILGPMPEPPDDLDEGEDFITVQPVIGYRLPALDALDAFVSGEFFKDGWDQLISDHPNLPPITAREAKHLIEDAVFQATGLRPQEFIQR